MVHTIHVIYLYFINKAKTIQIDLSNELEGYNVIYNSGLNIESKMTLVLSITVAGTGSQVLEIF